MTEEKVQKIVDEEFLAFGKPWPGQLIYGYVFHFVLENINRRLEKLSLPPMMLEELEDWL